MLPPTPFAGWRTKQSTHTHSFTHTPFRPSTCCLALPVSTNHDHLPGTPALPRPTQLLVELATTNALRGIKTLLRSRKNT